MRRRRAVWLAIGGFLAVFGGWFGWAWWTYPSDRTPEGAYLRIMRAVNRGEPAELFAYTEIEAQHACFTIARFRKQARQRVLEAYPEPERSRLAESYADLAAAKDGAEVFAKYATKFDWVGYLRRDLSGIDRVEISGERATVQTVRGTRYPFRRRPNGIWGVTLFTPRLVTDAQKAIRDAELIEKNAKDYERVRQRAR